MSMYFKYGTFAHDAGSVSLATSRRAILNSRGRVSSHVHTWNITGEVKGSSAENVSTKMGQLETAYAQHNQDAGLYFGTNVVSTHQLISNLSISGVKVTQFAWINSLGGGEMVTGRSFQIQLQAEYLVSGSGFDLLAYQETITRKGDGGPRYIVIPTDNSLPVVQQAAYATPVIYEQRGFASGLFGYPAANNPIPVGLNDSEASGVDYTATAGNPVEYTTSWFYRRLLGSPINQQIYPSIR